MKKLFVKLAYNVSIASLLISCGEEEPTQDSIEGINPEQKHTSLEEFDEGLIENGGPIQNDYNGIYSAKYFQNEDQSWGYEIYDDSSIFIRQPFIPSIQGNKGFSSAAFAQKTADYVIYKLNTGFFPPSLTKNELDSLGVLN